MDNKKVYIIAEAGVNHNGSLKTAKQMIDVAVEAGADAIKFQTFIAKALVSVKAPKAKYQLRTTDASESQLAMLEKLELNGEMHGLLFEYCQARCIQFLSTPFDLDSLKMLIEQFSLPIIKISSGDITNAPFLLAIAKSGRKVILSTGMSLLGEVEAALGVLAHGFLGREKKSLEEFARAYISDEGQKLLKEKVVLLHCTTEYPALFDEVNLRAMDTLFSSFGIPVGYSDHTAGCAVAIAAVARGARVIEKHFTLDKNLDGPDHKASLEPMELQEMIKNIRNVELALGSMTKAPTLSEQANKAIARKSLVAAKNVYKGEVFNESNLVAKRPGGGMTPFFYWDVIGRVAERDYQQDEQVE